jgi:hypothetical protein
MLKFLVLFIPISWSGNHFVLSKGNNSNKNSNKKCQKRIILESSRKMANGLLPNQNVCYWFWSAGNSFFLRRTTHCPPQTACLSFIKLLTCHLDLLRVLEVLHLQRGRRVRDRMVIGFTTTYAISAYHH